MSELFQLLQVNVQSTETRTVGDDDIAMAIYMTYNWRVNLNI